MTSNQRQILVLNPFGTEKYDEVIREMIEPVKLPDTELIVNHLDKGPDYIDYWTYTHLVTPDVIDRVYNAEREGYHGVFVACGYEPGVRAAREVVDIPVVGAIIPTVLLAHQLGARFSVFYNSKMSSTNSWDILRGYGVDTKCVSIKSLDLSLREIMKSPKLVDERVVEKSRVVLAEGAEVVILACTIVAAYFTGNVPTDLSKMVYLNCNICAFKYLEMLVELHQKAAIKVSRLGYYASPKDDNRQDFENFRAFYGYK